jgi:gamma-glutamyltranspeptidase/glutathione hydrolase
MMRSDYYTGRSPARSEHGMAATAHPQATLLALDILRAGGNAVDAGIAAMALLCVIEPHATGIGGDCFAIHAPGGRDPVGLNGSGRAPARATPDWYRGQGIAGIGFESPHSVTVPGAIDAWWRLHADHGRLPWDRLLAPAIAAAEDGYLVTDRVARDWARLVPRLAGDEVSARLMLPGGRAPAVGTKFAAPRLGATLRRIAAEGRDGFYRGPVAEDIVARLNALGGLHTVEDFAASRPDYVDLIATEYRGYRVCEIPPAGQGITALMMLNALAPEDPAALDAVDRIHLLAEITKAAYRRRDALIGDPGFADIPVERLLSAAETARIRAEVDMARVGPEGPLPDFEHRDTTYLCVVDSDRNALSLINSLFQGFGSCICAPESGVMLQNRGASFRLDPDHPNAIAPGKRPMHTIIPGMLCEGTRAVMPFGVMGGHYQPVGHAALLSNMLDLGMDVQEALAAPRSFARGGTLQLEPIVPGEVAAALAARGHAVDHKAAPLGGGQAIWIDHAAGTLTGGSEPRKDGIALGY